MLRKGLTHQTVESKVITQNNPDWPQIPNHSYTIPIVGGSGSGKMNALLSLIHHRPDIDKIFLCVKDPYESKYHYLIKNCEEVGLKHSKEPKAFIEYRNDMKMIRKMSTTVLKSIIQCNSVLV